MEIPNRGTKTKILTYLEAVSPTWIYKDEYFIGKPVEREKLLAKFQPKEGSINLYYGRIGSGKTYAATADILSALERGEVVYANWFIDFQEYDQRNDLFLTFCGTLGLKTIYYRFPRENFHYFHPDDVDTEFLSKLTDCRVFIDEGQWIFDSYEGTKFAKAKRKLILHTRHCNRELNIISQRPTAIQVSARGNVNRFYKTECLVRWPVKLFRRTEFQDMVDEVPDETKPISTRYYIGSRKVYNAYNSQYMREGIPTSQKIFVGAWRLKITERLYLFQKNLLDATAALMRRRRGKPRFNPIDLVKWDRQQPVDNSVDKKEKIELPF